MPKNGTSSFPRLAADGVLLAVSLFWGTSFAIVKEALAATSPANFLFIRFSLACLILLPVACTILAYLGQTWAQARTATTRTAIILSMEPVFAALFAWWWIDERIGLWGWLGAALILSGVIAAELKSNPDVPGGR